MTRAGYMSAAAIVRRAVIGDGTGSIGSVMMIAAIVVVIIPVVAVIAATAIKANVNYRAAVIRVAIVARSVIRPIAASNISTGAARQ
jgi:hypothetical protein